MREPVGHFYAAFAVQPWLLKPINRVNYDFQYQNST